MGNSAHRPVPVQSQFVKCGQDGGQSDMVVVPADIKTRNWMEALTPEHRVFIYTGHFDDGRIFSLGRQVRIAGFEGSLIAVGEFLPDQLDSLARCGFNHYLPLPGIPDGIEDPALENLVELPLPDEPGHMEGASEG